MILENRKPATNDIYEEVKPRNYKELIKDQVYNLRLEFIKPVEVRFRHYTFLVRLLA